MDDCFEVGPRTERAVAFPKEDGSRIFEDVCSDQVEYPVTIEVAFCQRRRPSPRGEVRPGTERPVPIAQQNGHGIGLQLYDMPTLAPADRTVLEPGMVLNVELPYYELGFGSMQIEDTLVVTDAEPLLLSRAPRELRVL